LTDITLPNGLQLNDHLEPSDNNASQGNPPYKIPPDRDITPLLYQEFVECTTIYHLSEKEDSGAISSDGEFIDAGRIDLFD
jgi:hypothetical protein